MTDLELIFTMLDERVTTEIYQTEKPEGMFENKKVANEVVTLQVMQEKTPKERLEEALFQKKITFRKSQKKLYLIRKNEEKIINDTFSIFSYRELPDN